MKAKNLTIILLLALVCQKATAQRTELAIQKAGADLYWETMPKRAYFVYQLPSKASNIDSINYGEIKTSSAIYSELYCRLLREWGVGFWQMFPNDKRRFEWFKLTLNEMYKPKYYADISRAVKYGTIDLSGQEIFSIDTLAMHRWLQCYQQFRKEFLESVEVKDVDKSNRLRSELLSELKSGLKAKQRFDINNVVARALEFASKYKPEDLMSEQDSKAGLIAWFGNLFSYKLNYGLTDQDLDFLIQAFESSDIPAFKRFAQSKKALMSLQKHPIELKAKTFDGADFNIKDYKGKLVLLDFWSLGCSVCIAKMPEIKDVYDKYKAKGFEVISACLVYSRKDEQARILDIHRKIGADWPLVLLGGNKGEQGKLIFDKYGWQGVPQLLLLKEDGKLIHFKGEMGNKGGLEKLVKQHFANKSNKTEGEK